MDASLIISQHRGELGRYLLARVKNKDISEDLLQDVSVKILQKLPQLRDPSRLRPWLFAIARHEVADYFNKRSYYSYDERKVEMAEEASPAEVCCLQRFVSSLPEIYRKPIELAYGRGMNYGQISRELNLTISNIKIRLKRGRDMIKENLQDCCGFEIASDGKLRGENRCEICNASNKD